MVTAPKHHTPFLPGRPNAAPKWHHPVAPISGDRLARGREPGPLARQRWAQMGARLTSGHGQGGRCATSCLLVGAAQVFRGQTRWDLKVACSPSPLPLSSWFSSAVAIQRDSTGSRCPSKSPSLCPLCVVLLLFLHPLLPTETFGASFWSEVQLHIHLPWGQGHCRVSAPEGTQVPHLQVQLSMRAPLCMSLLCLHCRLLPEHYRVPGPLAKQPGHRGASSGSPLLRGKPQPAGKDWPGQRPAGERRP